MNPHRPRLESIKNLLRQLPQEVNLLDPEYSRWCRLTNQLRDAQQKHDAWEAMNATKIVGTP